MLPATPYLRSSFQTTGVCLCLPGAALCHHLPLLCPYQQGSLNRGGAQVYAQHAGRSRPACSLAARHGHRERGSLLPSPPRTGVSRWWQDRHRYAEPHTAASEGALAKEPRVPGSVGCHRRGDWADWADWAGRAARTLLSARSLSPQQRTVTTAPS